MAGQQQVLQQGGVLEQLDVLTKGSTLFVYGLPL
jgi:hypothetical protein